MGIFHPETYPILFNSRYNVSLPAITREGERAMLTVLACAKAHNVDFVKVPKNLGNTITLREAFKQKYPQMNCLRKGFR